MDDDVEQRFSADYTPLSDTCDMSLCDHLTELVLFCNENGRIFYANPAAQQYSRQMLEGQPFTSLLVPDGARKGEEFFAAARAANLDAPTPPWELALGTVADYVMANFRGYHNGDHIVLIGEVEPAHVSQMHREMVQLTSELSEAQRQVQRQNRALQKSLDEQQRLMQTIQDLSAPIAPISDDVLLMPLVGHIDSHRANKITEEILHHVNARRARYVILDITSIIMIDTAVARHLLDTAQAIRLLGAQTVLVGVSPSIAETIVHLGIDLHTFVMHSDLQHAIAYVLRQRKRS
jgi:anti-anti-sigma factor